MPLADVAVGDMLRVRPGEKVPVDGVVVEGRSAVDESMVTGEPMPGGEGTAATAVTGGTINGTRQLTHSGRAGRRDTLLAQIVQMVGEAQRSRAPIQRLADRSPRGSCPPSSRRRRRVRRLGVSGPSRGSPTRWSAPSRC